MSAKHSIHISVPAALNLVDLMREQIRTADDVSVKKILLRAAIKIADLAIEQAATPKKLSRAA